MKQKAHLEDWSIIRSPFDDGNFQLTGVVRGHPKLDNGIRIVTSLVTKFNPDKNTALTLNTLYTLGQCSDSLDSWLKIVNKTLNDFRR